MPLNLDLRCFLLCLQNGETFPLILMLAWYLAIAKHCYFLSYKKIHLSSSAVTLITAYISPQGSVSKFIYQSFFACMTGRVAFLPFENYYSSIFARDWQMIYCYLPPKWTKIAEFLSRLLPISHFCFYAASVFCPIFGVCIPSPSFSAIQGHTNKSWQGSTIWGMWYRGRDSDFEECKLRIYC